MLDLQKWSDHHGLSFMKGIDIQKLSKNENRGYPNALLLVRLLPKEYIRTFTAQDGIEHATFARYEQETNDLADELATAIQQEGYHAISQSEAGIGARAEFNYDTLTSLLPHKKLAVLAGLGWIGKSNLLVTPQYGSALSMCSVLTDLPVKTVNHPILQQQCGNCNLCVKLCPAHVLSGCCWSPQTPRDTIVDVYHCETCLRCLAGCIYSRNYAVNKNEAKPIRM